MNTNYVFPTPFPMIAVYEVIADNLDTPTHHCPVSGLAENGGDPIWPFVPVFNLRGPAEGFEPVVNPEGRTVGYVLDDTRLLLGLAPDGISPQEAAQLAEDAFRNVMR